MGTLRDFVADLLEHEGAAIERVEPGGLDVLAPKPVRDVMGWPEFVRLGFGPATSVGVTPIGLEGDWLERFAALLGDRGRFGERQLMAANDVAPPNDPERLIDRALELPNAIWRLRDARPAWTCCLLLAFRYTAMSDEQREGMLWLGFNCGSGASLDEDILQRLRAHLAQATDWRAPEPDVRRLAGEPWHEPQIAARARPLIDYLVRRDLEPFMRAMARRLDRDRDRVHGYHDDLRQAALLKLAALRSAAGEKAEADRKRETARIGAIEREYAAKLEDLRHNYALRVSVSWVQAMAVYAPVVRYDILIKRRKGERVVSLDWHPAVRMMEPARSEWGLGLERARLVCDDHLHLTDLSGQSPCSSCGKGWCRACHGDACPRCARKKAALSQLATVP
jgi:hypothetical protein